MKITAFMIARQSLLLIGTALLPFQQITAQTFQRSYGASFTNMFTKVIQDGTNYYVLGQDEPSSGALLHATVTRLDGNGIHQWTLSLDIGSVWNDAVLTPTGDLMVVGATLPFDATSKSLIGVVTPSGGGGFSWVQTYDVSGRESFTRIVRSPAPQNPAFPYYVVGTQFDASNGSSTWDDVTMLNLNDSGTFNWKKIFPSTGDDEFARNLDVMPNGDLILSGNLNTDGVILLTDNTGAMYSGATPAGLSFSYADVATESGGGFYAVGGTFPGFTAYLSKYDSDLINLWDATISGLTAINQVWEEQSSGGIYVTGRGLFNGQNRAVLLRFVEVANLPVLEWVKYLDNGESSYTGGSTTLLSSNDIAFADGRIPASGGFGQLDAFLSVSDLHLNTCMTSEDFVNIETFSLLYNGPVVPGIEFFDFPTGSDLVSSAQNWQQEEICNNDPCQADFIITLLDACGHIQVTNASTGVLPLTYLWCNGSSTENLDVQLPCGLHTFCLTITDATGCTSSYIEDVTVTDDVPPVISCPSNITVTSPLPSFCSMVVNGLSLLTVTDNCSTPIVMYTVTGSTFASGQNDASGLTYNEGISTITYTATDACGNTSTCSVTVEVRCTMRSIVVNKYNDLDCDGVHDLFEPGLPGWIFTLVNNSTGQTYAGTTGSLGQHIFQNLPSGTFTLTETPRPGWLATNPSTGSMIVTVGSSDVTVEFGNCAVCMPDTDPFICGEALDVLFVLDNSGSMDASEFKNMRDMVFSAVAQIQSAYSNAKFGVVHFGGDCGEKIYMEHDFKPYNQFPLPVRRFPPGINDDLNVALLNTIKALNHVPNPNLKPTPVSYLNQRFGSNLWVIIFTDAFGGISGGSSGCTGSAMLPYTNSILLKQTKNAKITVAHLAPGASVNSISAAIASPGGTYNGPVANNNYDSNFPGPRQYIPLPQGASFINILPSVPACDSVVDHCCDSLMVMTTLNSTGGKCCATVDLKNKVGFPVTKFEAEVINSPGWVFNISSLAHASGYNWDTPPAGSIISINHTSGHLPLGTTLQALTYCLASTNTAASLTQIVVFRWYAVLPGDSIRRVICTDTLTTSCTNTISENCVALIDSSLVCNPDNPYEYIFNFTIQNLSGTPRSKIVLENLTPGFGFSQCNSSAASTIISVSSNPFPLPNGAVSSNLCVKIISPIPILTPQQMCFRIGLYSDSIGCNSADSICVLLKPCCDPCAMVAATTEPLNMEDACCYKIDLHRSCGYELFTKVETEILTPGVVFGAYSLGGPDSVNWFISPGATSTSITIGAISGVIQQNLVDDILQFCLDSITSNNQIPQKIVVRWYTSTALGDEVLCTDTIVLDVPVNCEKNCTDGSFSGLIFTWNQGTQNQAVNCGNAPISLSCPKEGEGYRFTGSFTWGDPHETTGDGKWKLTQIGSGVSHIGFFTSDPYFAIDLSPQYFDQPGLYEITLTSEDVDQTCSCTIQFNVDCAHLCECTALDVVQFRQRVERGFAQIFPENSCDGCFSPLALNDCETVEWFLNTTDDPPIGRSTGRETFCFSFPDDGDYDIIMEVSKKQDDGSNCDKQKRIEGIMHHCLIAGECANSVFANPSFGEGAIAGGLNSGGHSNNWKANAGNPKLKEEQIASLDGWTMLLSGNLDTSDILSSVEPICLEKSTGLITARTVKSSKSNSDNRLLPSLLRFYIGSKEVFTNKLDDCNGIDCYELGSIALPALDSGQWLDLEVPYDLSNWDAFDPCGGVLVWPYIFVTNGLSNAQGGVETYSYTELDNFCLNGTLVAIEELSQRMGIHIFPNPTSGKLLIQFTAAIPKKGVVQIFDLYGRLMLEENLLSGQSSHTLSIDGLSTGIYFARILDDRSQVWIEKVIKQ